MSTIERELQQQLARLGSAEKKMVLEYARTLPTQRGTSGAALLAALKRINIPPEDLRAMRDAIEEGCERIDPDGW